MLQRTLQFGQNKYGKKTAFFPLEIRPSKTLKKVSIPVWKESDCLQAYHDAQYDFTREDYVCAGDNEKDSSKVHPFFMSKFLN